MTQTEWIVSLDDDLKDYEELFVGNVRDGDRLIRCKDAAVIAFLLDQESLPDFLRRAVTNAKMAQKKALSRARKRGKEWSE